jgi:hypothetical protein
VQGQDNQRNGAQKTICDLADCEAHHWATSSLQPQERAFEILWILSGGIVSLDTPTQMPVNSRYYLACNGKQRLLLGREPEP